MRKRRHVIGYLFGLALALAGLTSAAITQTTAPKGNGKIASVVYEVSSRTHGIWVMNPDGSDRRQLTEGRDEERHQSPAWSPDGTQIAYVKLIQVGIGRWSYEIWLMNADGSNQRRLTQPGVAVGTTAWSPDGARIAFTGVCTTGFYGCLYVMNADGSNQTMIGEGWSPSWSPDGSKLVVTDARGMYILKAEGSGRTQITAPQNPSPRLYDYDSGPAWSPDGTRIIFTRWLDCDPGGDCGSSTLWTVNPDGTGLTQVSNMVIHDHDWSPDGAKIIFSSLRNYDSDLFVMNADGSGITNITNSDGLGEGEPSWQPVALAPGVNPIDEPQFFVTQHYRDFLSREPDPAGLAFWTNEITSCGGDAGCVEAKRVNVSAAFFLSIEFQQTGFYAIRVQRAAFGRKSADSSRVTRAAFLPEAQALGQNVVVGQGDWQGQLDATKQAYAERVVASAEFTSRYSSSLTAAEYVAALYASAGVTPTQAETDEAVAAFGAGGAAGRAAALRKVAESGSLTRAELNPAFVLMEYFGYLRRDPDQEGYDFWLAKLNQFNGDFVRAEMVKAFISSTEYRRRFGQP